MTHAEPRSHAPAPWMIGETYATGSYKDQLTDILDATGYRIAVVNRSKRPVHAGANDHADTALIERGEAVRRDWNRRPIPAHRALTIITSAGLSTKGEHA